jgi:hypothetical protein
VTHVTEKGNTSACLTVASPGVAWEEFRSDASDVQAAPLRR